VGDWDGDGDDTVGIFRPTGGAPEFHLNNQNDGSAAEHQFGFGNVGDKPVIGDWDGGGGGAHGTVTIGVFRPATARWYLRNQHGPSCPCIADFPYGDATDTPVTGDWDGDGDDTIGIFRPRVASHPSEIDQFDWPQLPRPSVHLRRI
jgi:hypothetical protein